MRPSLLPEIFFDFRKVIEVVPSVHFVGGAPSNVRALAAIRLRCRCPLLTLRLLCWCCCRALAVFRRLVFLPDQSQARQCEKFISVLDMLRAFPHVPSLAAGLYDFH